MLPVGLDRTGPDRWTLPRSAPMSDCDRPGVSLSGGGAVGQQCASRAEAAAAGRARVRGQWERTPAWRVGWSCVDGERGGEVADWPKEADATPPVIPLLVHASSQAVGLASDADVRLSSGTHASRVICG